MALGPTIVRKEQVNPLAAAGEGFMRFQIEKGQREIAMAQKQEDARFQNTLLTERATQLAGVEDQIATERMVKQFVLQRQLGKDAYQDELATKRAAAKQLHALQQINTKAEFAIADIRADEFKPEQAQGMVAHIIDSTPLSWAPEYADILQYIAVQNQDPANSMGLLKLLSLMGVPEQKPRQQQPSLSDEIEEVHAALTRMVERGMPPERAEELERAFVEKALTGTVERPGQQTKTVRFEGGNIYSVNPATNEVAVIGTYPEDQKIVQPSRQDIQAFLPIARDEDGTPKTDLNYNYLIDYDLLEKDPALYERAVRQATQARNPGVEIGKSTGTAEPPAPISIEAFDSLLAEIVAEEGLGAHMTPEQAARVQTILRDRVAKMGLAWPK